MLDYTDFFLGVERELIMVEGHEFREIISLLIKLISFYHIYNIIELRHSEI